jgi:hypothetical protein
MLSRTLRAACGGGRAKARPSLTTYARDGILSVGRDEGTGALQSNQGTRFGGVGSSIRWHDGLGHGGARARRTKSFFAAFFSKKAVLAYFT